MRKVVLPILIITGLGLQMQALAKKNLVVDLSKSTVYAFENDHLVKALVVNPGDSDTPTRPGAYRITQKKEKYRSNLVDIHNQPLKNGGLGAPMDFWMRLGGTGMGFHRSNLWRPNGRWGSHGCMRMSRAGARWLFNWTPINTPVTVVSKGVELASAVSPRYMKKSAVKGGQKIALRTLGVKPGRKVASSLKTSGLSGYSTMASSGGGGAAQYGEPELAPIKTVSLEEVQAPHLSR